MKHLSQNKRIIVASLRLPEDLYQSIVGRVSMEAEDLDFSKFVRRAIRREMLNSGFSNIPKEQTPLEKHDNDSAVMR